MYLFGGRTPLLTIVVPCYNEEKVLNETFTRLKNVIQDLMRQHQISEESQILFVDDESNDNTRNLIAENQELSLLVKGLKLSRNVGHQNALLAGLNTAGKQSDCIISIDADLQDNVEVIKDFIQKFHEGYEVVYSVRRERKTDGSLKDNSFVFLQNNEAFRCEYCL